MTATNQQMTSEQLAELSTLAAQLQAKAEANDDRNTAVMAYAVQTACSELEESRREFTAANATIHNLELKVCELESRTVTVKLPKRSVGEVMHMSGFSRDYAGGWCSGNDNAINVMKLAGIQVIEGEGQ